DPAKTLADLRATLGSAMAADALFNVDGIAVARKLESRIRIDKACDDSDTIGAAPEAAFNVKIVKADDSRVVAVAKTTTLAELRQKLGAWMDDGDQFESRGASVDRAAEARTSVEAAALVPAEGKDKGTNVISIAASGWG